MFANVVPVRFPQVICLPVGPRCDTCTLSSQGLCSSARIIKPKNKKRAQASVEIKYETAELEAKAADEEDHEAAVAVVADPMVQQVQLPLHLDRDRYPRNEGAKSEDNE